MPVHNDSMERVITIRRYAQCGDRMAVLATEVLQFWKLFLTFPKKTQHVWDVRSTALASWLFRTRIRKLSSLVRVALGNSLLHKQRVLCPTQGEKSVLAIHCGGLEIA